MPLTIEQEDLEPLLMAHQHWLAGRGGIRLELRDADLSQLNLRWADLRRVSFQGVNLSGSSLMKANLAGARLSRCRMVSCELVGANLMEADLSYSDLSHGDLYEAELSGCRALSTDFRWANLMRVRAQGGLFGWTMFYHSDLRRADFRDANLMGANFTGARMKDACFWGAHSAYINLMGATGLEEGKMAVLVKGLDD